MSFGLQLGIGLLFALIEGALFVFIVGYLLIEKKVIDVHVENGKRTQKENTTYIIYLENPMDYIKVVGNANYN